MKYFLTIPQKIQFSTRLLNLNENGKQYTFVLSHEKHEAEILAFFSCDEKKIGL